MATINQVMRDTRKAKKIRINAKMLKFKSKSGKIVECPQRCGVVVTTKILTPKKPNSAQRKVASIRIKPNTVINTYIPDENHKIASHAVVMFNKRSPKDLPGVSYSIIRGKNDAAPQATRKNKRSKYGVKKPAIAKAKA